MEPSTTTYLIMRAFAVFDLSPDPRLLFSSRRNCLTLKDLIKFESDIRRRLSSEITGIILNSVIATACQLYAVPAGINLWQAVVSVINLRKLKKEIKSRIKTDPSLKAMFDKEKTWWPRCKDIFLGVLTKLIFFILAAGISGLDNIAEGFANLATDHPTSHLAHFLTDRLHLDGGPSAVHETFQNLKTEHPHLHHFDQFFHKINASIADSITKVLNNVFFPTGVPDVSLEVSHDFLSKLFHGYGVSAATIAVVGVAMAAVYEFIQPAAVAGQRLIEKGVDKLEELLKRQLQKTISKSVVSSSLLTLLVAPGLLNGLMFAGMRQKTGGAKFFPASQKSV